MFATLKNALAEVKNVDVDRLSGAEAADLVLSLTEAERVIAAVRTLAVRRVDEAKTWQKDGHRTAAEWVAAKTGTTVGQAIGVLDTARRLEELPLTKSAFLSGTLSETQAREVSDAAFAAPAAERALLATARTQTVKSLREECHRVKAAAVPDEVQRYESIRRRRYFRHSTDADGAVRLDARLTPDAGAQVIAAIEVAKHRILDEARKAGLREPSEAYAADALVELVSRPDGDSSSGPRAMVHVLVDHAALMSGTARPDQRCELPGVGRVPVATARALTHDAIIRAVVTKGADIHSVVHVGRTVPGRIRTALEVRDRRCVVPDCGKTKGLEIDHYRVAYADGGPTKLDNLARLCRWHHYQKTHIGYRLSGRPGAWKWDTPSGLEGARPPP